MNFKHDFPFDPTAGYTPEQLLNLKVDLSEPADFIAFWEDTYRQAMSQPLNWTMRPSATHPGNDTTEVFDIEFDSLFRPGYRVGGWLTRPRGEIRHGAVFTHGYGGREAPELNPPLPAGTATIQPVLTGLPVRSIGPDQEFGQDTSRPHHVLAGIDNRDTYIHRFCVMDVWRAASVLCEAVPELKDTGLFYHGGSFGGGIGAMAVAWDKRFTRAYLSVPSFGNHPLRLQIPGTGSGESVRLYAQKHPQIARDVLPYFDAALCARQITVPTMVEAAFFDPSVTPVGQYSVYHSLRGPKKLFRSSAGHFEHSGTLSEQAALRKEIQAFFA